ncbi:MAG TPA: MCE family protein, partial [Mycobacterium sp.]
MKTFSERNHVVIGIVGVAITAAIVIGALQYQKLPFLNQGKEYSAYFADAGGLFTGAGVEVSGYPVGKVSSIRLEGPRVLVTFKIAGNIRLGDRTEAAIRTKSLLGSKVLNVTPRGGGQLDEPIPIQRTSSPYQLPDALGDLANTVSGIDTNQLSGSLSTIAQTFADTPPHLKTAVEGVGRFA